MTNVEITVKDNDTVRVVRMEVNKTAAYVAGVEAIHFAQYLKAPITVQYNEADGSYTVTTPYSTFNYREYVSDAEMGVPKQ